MQMESAPLRQKREQEAWVSAIQQRPTPPLQQLAEQFEMTRTGALYALRRHNLYEEWKALRKAAKRAEIDHLMHDPNVSGRLLAAASGLNGSQYYSRLNRSGIRKVIKLTGRPKTKRQRDAAQWLESHPAATVTDLGKGLGIGRMSAWSLLKGIGYELVWAKLD